MRKSQLYSIAFGFSLLVLLSFSVLLYNSINSFSEYSSLVENTQVILNNLQKIHSKVIDSETGQRGFLLTRDSTFLEPLLVASKEIPFILDTLEKLTDGNLQHRQNIDSLRATVWAKMHVLEETLNRSSLYTSDMLTQRLKDGKAKMDDFRRVIDLIMQEQQDLLTDRSKKKLEFEKITPSYFKAIISVTAIVSLVSFILLMLELKSRMEAQVELETKFHALNRSNAELQQIAHVTSHDLQEPLRKIRTFSDALVIKFQNKVPDEVMSILNRIDANAFRMRELVADLSAFTSLSTPEGKKIPVNLAALLEKVQENLAGDLRQARATIAASPLPSIIGYAPQLHILFRELLSNALKFSKSGVDPVITITSVALEGKDIELLNPERQYVVVTLVDNGIGFEKEYSNKIFILFQKLHNQEDRYGGKGLGLSLCQRIMANHEGFITASGEIGLGASFSLYFPL